MSLQPQPPSHKPSSAIGNDTFRGDRRLCFSRNQHQPAGYRSSDTSFPDSGLVMYTEPLPPATASTNAFPAVISPSTHESNPAKLVSHVRQKQREVDHQREMLHTEATDWWVYGGATSKGTPSGADYSPVVDRHYNPVFLKPHPLH